MTEIANVQMAEAWDGDEGADWARDWDHHDKAMRDFHVHLFEAAALAPGEHVLDIGCGNGETTREAGRACPDGRVLGVDLSSAMLAREVTLAEGLTNVQYEQVDAQVHPFYPGHTDIAMSRFGGMFFADRVAAFANINRALRPGGRLVMIAWRQLAENEWIQQVRGALALGRDLPEPPAGAPGPVGLADHDGVRAALRDAGYVDVKIEPVDGYFRAGTDVDDAYAFTSRSGIVRSLLGGLEPAEQQRGLDSLRAMLTAHDTADGVCIRAAAALISARRL